MRMGLHYLHIKKQKKIPTHNIQMNKQKLTTTMMMIKIARNKERKKN